MPLGGVSTLELKSLPSKTTRAFFEEENRYHISVETFETERGKLEIEASAE